MHSTKLAARICAELNLHSDFETIASDHTKMTEFFKSYHVSDFDHLQTYQLGFDLSSTNILLMKQIWNDIKKSSFKNSFTLTFVVMNPTPLAGPYRKIDFISGRLCTNLRLKKF